MSELVGEAYVRVHADTKFMKAALKRDLKSAGKDGAESLLASFDQTIQDEADRMVSARHQTLARAIVGGDFDAMFKKSGKTIEEFQKDTVANLTKIKDATEKNGSQFKQFQGSLDELEKWAQRSIAAREMQKQADAIDEAHKNALRLNSAFKEQEKIAEALGKHFDDLDTAAMRFDIQRLTKDIRAQVDAIDDAHAAALRRNKAFDAGVGKDFERSTERTQHWVSKLRQDLDKIQVSGGVGVIFGKGSRNNFLNFTGSVAGNMTKIAETIIKLPIIVADGAAQMIDSFKALQAQGQSVSQILGTGVAGAAAAAGPALAAVAAAAAGVVVVLPILVSLASALAAGLTAVAAAVSFAIAGALLPMVPVLVAVAASIAPIIIAVKELKDNMTDAQKHALVPMTKAWENLRAAMRPVINDLTKEFANWGGTLRAVTPFITDMGNAAVGVIKNLREQLGSPEMKQFLEAWSGTLPLIFASLGRAVNGLLVGLIAFFKPVLPYAERLAGAIEDAANNFAGWAKSAGGQSSIENFMRKAWDAANLLWQAIVNIGETIGNVFGVAMDDAGPTFLTWLRDLTQTWADWTGDVKNRQTLRDWFDNAIKVGKDLVTIVGQVFGILGDLDTAKSRQNLQDILLLITTLNDIFSVIFVSMHQVMFTFREMGDAVYAAYSALVTFGDQVNGGLSTAAGAFSSFGETANGVLDSVAGGIATFSTWVMSGFGLQEALPGIIGSFTSFGESVNGVLDSIAGGISRFSTWVMSGFGLAGNFTAIGEWIIAPFRWAYNVLLGNSIIPDIVNGIQQWLGKVPGIITGALATVGGLLIAPFRAGYSNLSRVLSAVPGLVSTWLRNAVVRIPAVLASVATLVTAPFRTAAAGVLGILRGVAGTIGSVVGSWVSRARAAVSGIAAALTGPFQSASRTISGIMATISGFISRIPGLRATAEAGKEALRTIMNAAIDRYNSLPLPDLPRMATGGITTGRTIAGESGQELVIPLHRSIGSIDPSVREIAALIRGQGQTQAAAGRSLSIAPGAIQVVSPNANPLLVAESLMDRLVAAAT